MHVIPYTVPITVVDPKSCKYLIGKKGVIEGHNVEIVSIKEHYAVVRDTNTGETWKLAWGKLIEYKEEAK